MARHRPSDLVLMDDDWCSDLAAKSHGLAVMSTARLALKMVAGGALDEDEGFLAFESATPDGVGRDRFEDGLRRLRGLADRTR